MLNRTQTPSDVAQWAKDNRRQMTRAESALWRHLRGRQLTGLRFRRQEPLGPFIADFYCATARLAIELDGSSHEGRETYDALRTEILSNEGYRVLRFSNAQVERDVESVLLTIVAHCKSPSSSPE